jgi:superoxide dismutase, Fe-Mn family
VRPGDYIAVARRARALTSPDARATPVGVSDGPWLERREFLRLCGALGAASVIGCASDPPAAPDAPDAPTGRARYEAKDYSALRGLRALPDAQVIEHVKLYEGYVARTNDLLRDVEADPASQELRRRLGFEWDGMRLHELYFDALAREPRPLTRDGPLARALAQTWGSVDGWRSELLGTAKLPGIGWTLLVHDPESGALQTVWVNDHEDGHLAGTRPLLALDLWEHAFVVYRKPTERAAYVDELLSSVDWSIIEARFAG